VDPITADPTDDVNTTPDSDDGVTVTPDPAADPLEVTTKKLTTITLTKANISLLLGLSPPSLAKLTPLSSSEKITPELLKQILKKPNNAALNSLFSNDVLSNDAPMSPTVLHKILDVKATPKPKAPVSKGVTIKTIITKLKSKAHPGATITITKKIITAPHPVGKPAPVAKKTETVKKSWYKGHRSNRDTRSTFFLLQ